jgi:hypothetical protein
MSVGALSQRAINNRGGVSWRTYVLAAYSGSAWR